MSEQWLGLHNRDRHKSVSGEWAECLPELGGCLSECGDGDPCRCCLAARDLRGNRLGDVPMSDPCVLRLTDDGEMMCMNHRSMLDAASDTRCEFMHVEWAESQIETLHDEVERLTAELAESEAARTFAEGHSAALSKQLDRVNMLRIRALNGLREQTKVTIDQGVALADRDQKIAELAAEVEWLTDAPHESEMAREELRKALAERDQKIEEALARLQWAGCKVRGCSNPSCATVHEVQAILRGES